MRKFAYLNLDQLLYAINNKYVFMSRRCFSDDCFITSSHVPILESLRICLVIVQISQDNGWRFDEQLAWFIISCHFFTLGCHNLALNTRQERPRRSEPDVVRCTGGYNGASFG